MRIEKKYVPTDVRQSRAAALLAFAVLVPAALATRSWADSVPVPAALVNRHCNACHAVNEQLIGPPLLAVAARYGGAADRQRTIEVLAAKIRAGGGGNWGIVPMVPNTSLSAEEARSLVLEILSLKPNAG
jgi:cytochrome c